MKISKKVIYKWRSAVKKTKKIKIIFMKNDNQNKYDKCYRKHTVL